MKEIRYKPLKRKEIEQIRTIDRAESIYESYEYKEGILILVPDHYEVSEWEDEELDELIAAQYKIIDAGGIVIGAFDDKTLAGAVSIEKKKRGSNADYCKMDMLYVSSNYRGRQIGQHLIVEAKREGKAFGATKLYISATPTKATVDFYLKSGATLTEEPDAELLGQEPLDIHLELKI
ncbi:N-acetyltransferase [Pedobacter sp. KBW06]|uniref:GNAT family N-acetyltransferase n=1 Tax=Pedobacter sp. KBW06 TaxID=2153359 RepID=UPI000F5974C6|nr:GNAT family N-acetyltransferase [Pedobacter sp. KBW06]RQO70177.1 N-acetyltransferase [Pedobacter sp. KBW06]